MTSTQKNPLSNPMETGASQSASPMVSVVILNYKRRDALILSLDSVKRQEYPEREIIVVDNASGDGISEFLATNYPEARLIELPENLGACAGRNAGIRAARGEIIVTLDNDIFFDSPFELGKIVKAFESRPQFHVFCFQLLDAQSRKLRVREWCHPRGWQEFGQTEFETNFFVEGASAYRREVFDVAGLYYDPIFIGCEGHDMAMRILDSGFRILYTPQIRARHLMSQATRTRERPYYFYTRNYIWIAYKDYYFAEACRFLFPKLLMMAYFSLRMRCLPAFFRGLRDGIYGLKRLRTERTPISRSTARYFDALERMRPNWRTRFVRHRAEPQI